MHPAQIVMDLKQNPKIFLFKIKVIFEMYFTFMYLDTANKP